MIKFKITKVNGEPFFSKNSLIMNQSTRLKFSIWVIIANFTIGIIGMLLKTNLESLGIFLSLCNSPLYAYIWGRTVSKYKIEKSLGCNENENNLL